MAAEVCIVGCGPAGLALALCLRNSGLDILILESGHAGPADEPQLLGKGLSTGIHYPPLESTRYRGFGGSSALWGTHPGDFDKGSLLAPAFVAPAASIVFSILGLTLLGDAIGERFERGRT